MRVVVQNPSSQPRRDWVTLTIPVGKTPLECGSSGRFVAPGGVLPVVAGPQIGRGVQIVHVRADIGPFQTLFGTLDWSVPLIRQGWKSAAPIRPEMEIVVATPEAEWTFDLPSIGARQVRSGAVLTDVYTWDRPTGCPFIPTLWLYRPEGLDLIRFELTIRMSDPMSKRVSVHVDEISISSPAPISIRWAKQCGRAAPSLAGDRWSCVLLKDDHVGDSQAICASGALLYYPGEAPRDATMWAEHGLRLQSLAAEMESGPCFAICDGWKNGAWGPDPTGTLRLPFWVDQSQCIDHAVKVGNNFYRSVGDPWQKTRLGLALEPGRTGDQQGFGMAKALDALMLTKPLMIDEIEFSAIRQLANRPGHYCEQSGEPVLAKRHLNPRWVTWNEITHFDASVSPQRFGKVDGLPTLDDTHGWWGRDAEHHSPLVEVAAYALTGSCQIEDLLFDMSERMKSEITVPSVHGSVSTNAIGAARAVGRTLQAASWIDWAIDDEELMPRMRRRFEECIWPQWRGRANSIDELLDPRRDQVRVIDVFTDDRMPLGVGWRPPFEAMGAYGVYLLWRRYEDPRMLALVYAVGKTILSFGFRSGRMLWGVHIPDPEVPTIPLTADQYDKGGDWFQEGGGDWDWWGFQGLVATRRAAEAVGDLPLQSMCQRQMDRIRSEANDMFAAQGKMFHVEQFWRYFEWTLNL